MKQNKNKKVAFHTLGCKVNQYDTQSMLEKFLERGYEAVEFHEKADVYIINTCTVTGLGDRKSRQMIRRAHRINPDAVIAVVGCYAQTASEEVISIPGVNLVLGTQDRDKIVDLVEQAKETGTAINAVGDIMKVREFEEIPISSYEGKTRAVLKVQEGCNQFCSYCIIPYARGPIRSRRPESVVSEVERLVDAGFKEFVLTGIHVASYGKDLGDTDLLSLIQSVHSIEGVERIRLGSLEPTFITQDYVNKAVELPKLCQHYHLSLQSGSDSVLKRMNRGYTTQQYRQAVDTLRKFMPNVAITTDIMVGFPGESQEEFNETMDFVREIRFSKIHVFQYSPRAGTKAANFPNQVAKDLKEQRSRELIELGKELEKMYFASFLGREEQVLFEEESKNKKGLYEGYTQHYIRVAARGNPQILNEIRPVLLQKIEENYMLGSIVSN